MEIIQDINNLIQGISTSENIENNTIIQESM